MVVVRQTCPRLGMSRNCPQCDLTRRRKQTIPRSIFAANRCDLDSVAEWSINRGDVHFLTMRGFRTETHTFTSTSGHLPFRTALRSTIISGEILQMIGFQPGLMSKRPSSPQRYVLIWVHGMN